MMEMGRGPPGLVGAGSGLWALTFPAVSVPLMTHGYTMAQEAVKQTSSQHWTEPLSSVSAVMFSVCRYRKRLTALLSRHSSTKPGASPCSHGQAMGWSSLQMTWAHWAGPLPP